MAWIWKDTVNPYTLPTHRMYMTEGVSGLIEDVFSLLNRIRLDHGLQDNSNIVFMGHSTGCLVLTRAAQILYKRDPLQKVGGLIMTAPLYGIGRLDGTEIPILKSRWLLRAVAFFLRCLNPRKVLYNGYVTESDDRTIPRGVNTQALQKCMMRLDLRLEWNFD
jgi:alpha-beta hydrolase superfamily lysophospholipase